ncbi:hypothetical protein RP20_CCG023233 [Aedes albopictus]|nr:hypothetical protein RP20_CCG023233 [Aedes albopictus]
MALLEHAARTQFASTAECSEYRKLSGRLLEFTSKVPTCEYFGDRWLAGGESAEPREFPHMASLGWRKASLYNTIFFRCGGSLISERFILTAAHCLVHIGGVFPSFVRLGEVNLLRHNDEMHPDDYEIEGYFPHPHFRRRNGKYNDIALLKLTQDVTFGDSIRPACLYGEETSPSEEVFATGYGSQAYYEDFSNKLVKASLEIYDNKRCDEKYAGTRALPLGMTDGQLCAGGKISGHDTCPGDSGGPLQVTDQENDCVFVVFGIISFGSYCGGINPAIYTRVAAYLDWIEGIVWP